MQVSFDGPVGRLEGVLWEPEGGLEPRAAVVMCHPHPVGGGSMDNNVVHRAARGLQEAGLAVLRFNFRSVGRSEGEHDGEGAEDGDLSAALDELERRYPDLDLWAGGFSFGSRTVVRVSLVEARIQRVLLVALPVLAYDCAYAEELEQPGMALMAELDDFGTLASLKARLPRLAAHLELQEIAGQGHFFNGALEDLRVRITDWALRSLS